LSSSSYSAGIDPRWRPRDIHWLQTVKIPRSTIEAALGAKQLESRARNFLVLGMSLAPLFDIANVHEFLRALTRVLDEWESFAEGGGGKVVRDEPWRSVEKVVVLSLTSV
jgi:hypothetical protein